MAASTLARKARYTTQDIAHLVIEAHECLHKVDGKIDGLVGDVAATNQRVARVEGYQSGIATHLRVPAVGETMSFWGRWKTQITTAGAVFGAIGAFVAAYPLLRVVFLAIDAYLTAAR